MHSFFIYKTSVKTNKPVASREYTWYLLHACCIYISYMPMQVLRATEPLILMPSSKWIKPFKQIKVFWCRQEWINVYTHVYNHTKIHRHAPTAAGCGCRPGLRISFLYEFLRLNFSCMFFTANPYTGITLLITCHSTISSSP